MYHLTRISDKSGDVGPWSQALIIMPDGKIVEVDEKPTVGCVLRVGSYTTRSYQTQDYWQTSVVVEILEEKETENEHFMQFRTASGSIYEWKGE